MAAGSGSRIGGWLGALAGLAALGAVDAAAQDVLKLGAGEAAIVFMVEGRGVTGDIQVRDARGASTLWDTVVQRNAVRRFVVASGSYRLELAGGGTTQTISATAGRTLLVSLAGDPGNGHFRMTGQRELPGTDIAGSALPAFIEANRLGDTELAPVQLGKRGAGLVFHVRTDN